MVAVCFDVGIQAAAPSCPTAPLTTSRRRRAQRARAHARVVLGVVRAVEALHGLPRGRTSHRTTPEEKPAATDIALIAFQESFDAAGDQNDEKADNTPDEDLTVTVMEPRTLQEPFGVAEDETEQTANVMLPYSAVDTPGGCYRCNVRPHDCTGEGLSSPQVHAKVSETPLTEIFFTGECDEDSTATPMELSAMQEPFDAADDQNEDKADITPEDDSAATDMELGALHESLHAADDRNEEEVDITPDEDIESLDAAEDQNGEQADITPDEDSADKYARRPYEPMPAPERAQRVRRRHALICEEFGLVPDEDSAADSVVIDHVRRVELGTLRESFHATTEEHEEKAAITPDEYPTATDKELSALHKSIDEADDPNEEKADITIAEDLIAADMELSALQESLDAADDQNEEKAHVTPHGDSTAPDTELGTLQESFDAADAQNEEKADITPDEDSTATDIELSALQESFDAADDQNEEKADITPKEDTPVTDMELNALHESFDAADDQNGGSGHLPPREALPPAYVCRDCDGAFSGWRHCLTHLCKTGHMNDAAPRGVSELRRQRKHRCRISEAERWLETPKEKDPMQEKTDITPDEDSSAPAMELSAMQEPIDAAEDQYEENAGISPVGSFPPLPTFPVPAELFFIGQGDEEDNDVAQPVEIDATKTEPDLDEPTTEPDDTTARDTRFQNKGERTGEYGTRVPTCSDARGYDKQVAANRNHNQYVLGNPGQSGHLQPGKLGLVLDDGTRASHGQQGTVTTPPACHPSPDDTPRAPYVVYAKVLTPLSKSPAVDPAKVSSSATAPQPTMPPPQPKLPPSSPPATPSAPPPPALTPETMEASKQPDHRGQKPAQPARPAHVACPTGSAGHAARRVRTPNTAALKRAVTKHPAIKWNDSMAKLAGQKGEVRLDDPSDLTTDVAFTSLNMVAWLPTAALSDVVDAPSQDSRPPLLNPRTLVKTAGAPPPPQPPPQPKLPPSSPPAKLAAPPQPALTPEIIAGSTRPNLARPEHTQDPWQRVAEEAKALVQRLQHPVDRPPGEFGKTFPRGSIGTQVARLLAHHPRLHCQNQTEVTHMLWLFRQSTRAMPPRPSSSRMLNASRTELLRAQRGHGQPSSLDHQRGPRQERRPHWTLRKLARLTTVAQRARLPTAVLTPLYGRG